MNLLQFESESKKVVASSTGMDPHLRINSILSLAWLSNSRHWLTSLSAGREIVSRQLLASAWAMRHSFSSLPHLQQQQPILQRHLQSGAGHLYSKHCRFNADASHLHSAKAFLFS
ncbi:MAG: hypothetical protein HY922_15630 [Elusimicrobia bacterium]|nr:hypothetical protein [Elusimicrobiota bacterium]